MNTITQLYRCLLLAIVAFSIAQNINAQDAYSLELDHICAEEFINDLQKNAANELRDKINEQLTENGFSTVDFKVLGYNLYPILGAVDEEFGLETAFEMVEGQLEGKSNYLAIVKYFASNENDEYSLVQEKVLKYKVYVDLPDEGGYEDTSNLEKDALVSYLGSFLIKKFNNSNNPVFAEVATIEEIWKYLEEPKNLESLLLDLQFVKFEVPSEEQFSIARTITELQHTEIDAYDNVYNYGGYVMNGESLEEALLVDDPGDLASFTSSYYLAGREVNKSGEFEAFYDQFSNDGSKVKLFIYFDFETEVINTITKEETSISRNEEKRFGYYKMEHNLSETESNEILDNQYDAIHEENTEITSNDELSGNCNPSWKFGRKCIYNNAVTNSEDYGIVGEYVSMQAATLAGFIDGFLGTIQFLVKASSFLGNNLFEIAEEGVKMITFRSDSKAIMILGAAFSYVFEKEENSPWEILKDIAISILQMNPTLIATHLIHEFGKVAMKFINKEISDKFGGSISEFIAYQIGVVAFDAVLTGVTGGAYLGPKIIARGSQVALNVGKSVKNGGKSFISLFNKLKPKLRHSAGGRGKAAYCTIGSGGCFVKDTPVMLASKSDYFNIKKSSKAIAIAAALPFVTVPIQEVQLLDFAVANISVNDSYGYIASNDEDIFMSIMYSDPYISDQQRARDKYILDDKNWNEVVFEEVNGRSTAKFALHSDWIIQNEYQIDAIVNLNLPEQGISGPFKVTSIKHIIPQKKPVDEDESDDYVLRPITALFTHVSDQVYNISFDNGEVLGVTQKHPIYSVTSGDWRQAGELEIGEKVLTKFGNASVTGFVKEVGSETVYNLEVKELHNFLVGNSGIVVHNTYAKSFVDEIVKGSKVLDDLPDGPQKSALLKLRQMYNSADPDYQKFMTQFSDGVHLEFGENGIKVWKLFKNSDDTALKALKTDKAWISRASKWMDEGADLEKIGGKIFLRKDGINILEIKNGKILPKKYDYVPSTQNPKPKGIAVGEASDGYQLHKHGDDLSVRRVPDKSSYQSDGSLIKLTEHEHAHTLEKHGHDVTDDALRKRANEGIAPDGSVSGNPSNPYKPFSSKFSSPEKLKLAYNNTNPSSSAWSTRQQNQYGGWDVIYEDANIIFGKGIPPPGDGIFENLTKVKASYDEVSPGVFELVTMFPIK